MKNHVRRVLALTLTVCLATFAASCGTVSSGYEKLFGGSYTLEIRPTTKIASQLQSLYIIVAPKTDVQEPLSASSKYGDLLDEDLMKKYTSFVQYEPLETGSWKLVFQGNQSSFVETSVDDDVLDLEIKHELVDKSGVSEFCVIVLAFYGSEGFEQVTISHTSLDANAEQVLEVSGGSLNLHDA